jgi:hypothetical protein
MTDRYSTPNTGARTNKEKIQPFLYTLSRGLSRHDVIRLYPATQTQKKYCPRPDQVTSRLIEKVHAVGLARNHHNVIIRGQHISEKSSPCNKSA